VKSSTPKYVVVTNFFDIPKIQDIMDHFFTIRLSKRYELIAAFLFFTAIILLFTFTNHTFLGIQDEVQLQATLSAADPKNYDTSYPLALFVGALYTHFPDISWYSIVMLFFLWVIAFFFAVYLTQVNSAFRFF